MSCSRVTVRVPASTSNLGPGFDCLGLALKLYNTVELTRNDAAAPARGMIADTAAAFFKNAGDDPMEPFGFEANIEGDVPVSRGLGSSVTVRLGILMGLAELVRETRPLTPEQILRMLIALEGHPDNAVPSFLGGFAVCAPGEGGFSYTQVPVKPELSFVTLIPELRLSTATARSLLPSEIPFRHAVENMQRTARIASIFCTGEYASLRGLFFDHLHQPARQVLIPGFARILAAANEAGALGSFLSGSGSTLMAVTLDRANEISRAMLDAAKAAELPAQAIILQADNDGAVVVNKS